MTSTGIGLRKPHYEQILTELPKIDWLEVHSENFLAAGGNSIKFLHKIRHHYPISLHGVGLSLGSSEGILKEHLMKLYNLIVEIEPFLVSEHLSWGYVGGVYLPDLLPIPYHEESLEIFAKNIHQTQDFLKREILIENPSTYLEYTTSVKHEADFLTELCQRTGAKILLDVNNVFVSASNHNWDAYTYIDSIPAKLVKEIHLAGHSIKELSADTTLRIDTHDAHVCEEVWNLYKYTLEKIGPQNTLIEWDANIPALSVLLDEAKRANEFLSLSTKSFIKESHYA